MDRDLSSSSSSNSSSTNGRRKCKQPLFHVDSTHDSGTTADQLQQGFFISTTVPTVSSERVDKNDVAVDSSPETSIFTFMESLKKHSSNSASKTAEHGSEDVQQFLDKIINKDLSHSTRSSDFKTPLPMLKTRGRPGSRKSGTSVSFSGLKDSKTAHSSTPKYGSSTSGRTSARQSTISSGSKQQTLVIAGISEGRGVARGEIGLASFDLRHPELCIAQFSDSVGYSKLRVKLQILSPIEIVVPESFSQHGSNMAALVDLLRNDFPKTQITTVDRKYFNSEKGSEIISRLKVDECSTVHKDIYEKYYCLASVAALVKYVEHIQNMVFAAGSLKITYKGLEKTCMIDPMSVKQLELIVSLKDSANAEASLNGILNSTATGCGARMLRANILQPPADNQTIEKRLDAIEELLNEEQGFKNLKSLISRMVDVYQLIGLCVNLNREETIRTAEYKLTQIIYLKHSLDLIDDLRGALAGFECQIFKDYREHMLCDNRFKEIAKKIQSTLSDVRVERGALNMRTQKCFAVRPGLNGLLDVARRTYTELIEDVYEAVEAVAEESGMPFRVAYTSGRNFHLQLHCRKDPLKPTNIKLPKDCILVERGRTAVTCSTRDLVKLNDRINQSVNEIFLMSSSVVTELLASIRQDIGCLYNLTEAVAVLDMIVSLANYCSVNECVRPIFTSSLAIKQGRHPLLETLTDDEVAANDTDAQNLNNRDML